MSRVAALQPWFAASLDALPIADLRLDSRQVCANDLFFALSDDAQVEAHMAEAGRRGAAAIVVDSCRAGQVSAAIPVLAVPALQQQLGAIADAFYGAPSAACCVVGITGTNGKTSCSHWLAQAWQQLRGEAGVIGTLGCGLVREAGKHDTGMTTPDVLSNHRLLADLVASKAGLVAMEVSSHALEQGRIDGVRVDTAIFTNLTRDHLDYHGDMASYGAAKRRLFERTELKAAVINTDDRFGKTLHGQLAGRGIEVLSYAIEDREADLGVERFEVTGRGLSASIRTPWGRGALQSRFPGGYNLLNVLAVVATLCRRGMDLSSVLEAVGQLQAVPGRTQIVSGDQDDILVVVDYAHTPDALEKILQALRQQAGAQLLCVFGCGGNRDPGKRPQMAAVAETLADRVIVTSDNPRDERPAAIIEEIVAGFQRPLFAVIEDRAAAIAAAIRQASAGDVVLLAGKGHEPYQEISGRRLPFSDIEQAQLALRHRREQAPGCTA